MSRIVTFYSYKGGVGRTFALANIAVLLARRSKRVLMMDWDLEAPGLHRYFTRWMSSQPRPGQGLIHLLHDAAVNRGADWRPHCEEISVGGSALISLIPSGDRSPDYVDRVRTFSWSMFFEQQGGAAILERWRDEWRDEFDFVLLDSRTGITDSGGICTILLPDLVVLVFAANEQSFERGTQVIAGAQQARRVLDVRRPPLTVLPLLGRFDGREEVDEGARWLDRFADELKPFYDDWLPARFHPRQILELTKVPYVTKFSFGEPLPVVTQGTRDPDGPGFYLDNVAALLASDFAEVAQIIAPREAKQPPEDEVFEAVAQAGALVQEGRFDEARAIIGKLPEELADVTTKFLGQIGEQEAIRRTIDAAIAESRDLVDKGEFGAARESIRRLGDEPEELHELKLSLLGQIDEAEASWALKRRFDDAVDRSRQLVEKGEFDDARHAIAELPDQPAELAEAKKTLLAQIGEAQHSYQIQQQVNAAVEEANRHVGRGQMDQARAVIEQLPDHVKELKELKVRLLGQIEAAEQALLGYRSSSRGQPEVSSASDRKSWWQRLRGK